MTNSVRKHNYQDTIFDIVYTWVDFTNDKWKNDYVKYYNKLNNTHNYDIINRSNSNLEELKYSLRSIEKHLKVNIGKIYIVSNYGSKPDFLAENNNVIIIDYLHLLKIKTFSSQAIESVLHKIDNLREYFLYFNDDCLLNSDIYIDDLIDRNGNLVWYCENNFFISLHNKFPIIDLFNLDSGVSLSRKYTCDIILRKNEKENINFLPLAHCFRMFKKSMIKKFITKYEKYIKKMRKIMFRNNRIFCFTDGFYMHYLINGKLELRNNKNTVTLVQRDNEYSTLSLILYYYNTINIYQAYKFDFLCIEDIRKKTMESDTEIKVLLDKIFNKKSKYEKK